ncbi:hypothetical protein SCHPADRAFT_988665 [Schizopora paradoxa]|uniref:DUF6533 domain-containing protein n=1 Tax=Schizopora paradoxa TaxID=27342 RepID=A0A0H2RKL8_9AGAM|nr:hypothetical protein SCHPADRAFT_988665 [Schizopora paradoxa]
MLSTRSTLLRRTLASIMSFQYFTMASAALFYYDFLITFGAEVHFVWKKGLTYRTNQLLFLALRYTCFFAYIPTLLFELSPPISFKISQRSQLSANFFRRKRNGDAELGKLELKNFIQMRGLRAPSRLNERCKSHHYHNVSYFAHERVLFAHASQNYYSVFKASCVTTISFDTLISFLTISRTYRMFRENRRAGLDSRLTNMLLRDGSFYYVIMTCSNVLNFTLFLGENLNYIESGAGSSSELMHSFSVIIVSRMMLNIMQIGDPQNEDDSNSGGLAVRNTIPILSTLEFPSQSSSSVSFSTTGTSIESDP